MTTERKLRIALIGLGDIAQKAYLPIIANHALVSPILCTRDKVKLAALSSKYRINEFFESIDELINSKPDAVMIHSATDSHYEIAAQFLEAKIPVFVDKPISYSLEECNALLDLSITHNTLLYIGFNRRFAPLVQKVNKEQNPVQIMWQKNRANLPGDPRVFIYDDFIHVIDSLLFLGTGAVSNLHVRCQKNEKLLENIQVFWEQGNALLQGNMNRISGFTQEQVDYYTANNSWSFSDFNTGFHFGSEKQDVLKFDSWESTLAKKGFHNMIEDWLKAIPETEMNYDRIASYRATHQLCEEILQQVLKNNI